MLSLDFIRTNKAKILEAAKNKGRQVDLDKIISLDDERRKLIQQTQKLREERNKLAKQGKPHSAEGSVRGKEEKDKKFFNEEELLEESSEFDIPAFLRKK